jgi:hypothetical protein
MDDLVNENLDFPFPDAVQEFSAQTSNMGVELGGLSGGALNVVTKSGTNDIHGDVFWFVRNTALNASNFFSQEQDQLKRNQFGFTLGGPVVKNKLFAFGGYQKLIIRQAAGNTRDLTLTAPSGAGTSPASMVHCTTRSIPACVFRITRFPPTAFRRQPLSYSRSPRYPIRKVLSAIPYPSRRMDIRPSARSITPTATNIASCSGSSRAMETPVSLATG